MKEEMIKQLTNLEINSESAERIAEAYIMFRYFDTVMTVLGFLGFMALLVYLIRTIIKMV